MHIKLNQPAKQYKSISLIKAFACISVVVAHWKAIFESMGSPRIDRLVFDGPLVLLIYSSMGVSIFLMLSAALAALKVYRNQEIRPGEEVLKRYVRLALPIFTTSLIVLLLQRAGAIHTAKAGALLGNDWIATRYTEPLKVIDLFRISFVTALLREENSFYIPFWMMSYIFLGSLTSMGLAMIIRGFNRRGKMIVFAFLILAMSLLDSYYLCIVLGNLLAMLLAGQERRVSTRCSLGSAGFVKDEGFQEGIAADQAENAARQTTPSCSREAGCAADSTIETVNLQKDTAKSKKSSDTQADWKRLFRRVLPALLLLISGMKFSTLAYKIAWNINAKGIGAPLNDSWFWQVIAGFAICLGFIQCFETVELRSKERSKAEPLKRSAETDPLNVSRNTEPLNASGKTEPLKVSCKEQMLKANHQAEPFNKDSAAACHPVLLIPLKALDFLGQISYEVFLTHWFVMCSFSCWFYTVHAADHMHVSILLNFILSCALILICSVLYHILITKRASAMLYEFLRRRLLKV